MEDKKITPRMIGKLAEVVLKKQEEIDALQNRMNFLIRQIQQRQKRTRVQMEKLQDEIKIYKAMLMEEEIAEKERLFSKYA